MAKKHADNEHPLTWDPAWNDLIDGYKEILIARAKYKGTYKGSPDLLKLVESAEIFSEVYSLDEWNSSAESYPDVELLEHQITKAPHEDAPARAYYLTKAMGNLLEMIGAPAAIKSDLLLFLSGFVPRGAEKYADIQRAMIENIGSNITQTASDAEADRTTVHDLIARKAVIRPKK